MLFTEEYKVIVRCLPMYVSSSPGRSGGSPGMAVAVMASTRV